MGMIHRRALDAMIDKSDALITPPITKQKERSKKRDDMTSMGETSDIAESPGELSQIEESVSRAKKILEVVQVERISVSSVESKARGDSGSGEHHSQISSIHSDSMHVQEIRLEDNFKNVDVKHPIAGAWHDSSNVSGSAINPVVAPSTPGKEAGEDEVQSILGSLSSVSQRYVTIH